MVDIAKIINNLSPEERKIFELQLKEKGISLPQGIGGMVKNTYSSIEAVPERPYYPVSAAQKRMYVLDQIEGANTSYNISKAMRIEGTLDKKRLEDIFRQLIKRHEAFRTSFALIDGEPVQRIHKDTDFCMTYIKAEENSVAEIIDGFIKPFDLSKAPLLRVSLIQMSQDKHILLLDMHHIISDGTSMGILIDEFTKLNNEEALPELRIQYKDFSEWQNQFLKSEWVKQQEAYWLQQFAKTSSGVEIPVLNLPTDYQRPPVQTFEGDIYAFEVGEELTKRLRKLCQDNGTTLFMVLLAAYNVLLSRATGQEDIIVGGASAGRNHAELKNIIGMFISPMAFRNHPKANLRFVDFLKQVRENALKAFENQDYQLEMLLEKLELKRDLSRSPLFDTMINLQVKNDAEASMSEVFAGHSAGLKVTPYEFGNRMTKFDIILEAFDMGTKVEINCNYRTRLFKSATIKYFMTEYVRLLGEIVDDPKKMIKQYRLLNRYDLESVASNAQPAKGDGSNEWKVTKKTIVAAFEEQAELNGSKLAARGNEKEYTYCALNKMANRIAAAVLEAKADKRDIAVALLFEHKVDIIGAILGVLKAGGIYVPLDAEYPHERLTYMLNDSGADMILTDSVNRSLAVQLKAGAAKEIDVIDVGGMDSGEAAGNPCVAIAPEQAAYIMYTSGSTGKPKGVVQTHENIMNLLGSYMDRLHIHSADRIALFTSYSHTVSVIDLFSALLSGACVLPYNIKEVGSIAAMPQWLRKEAITIIHTVPTVYRYCMEKLKENEILAESIRLVILGGEAVTKKDVGLYKTHFNDACLFINLLGASEVLVSTAYQVNKHTELCRETVPAGYFIDGVEAYLLDDNNEEVPVFGLGEIVYKSDYLATGYWHLPEKTNEVFVKDPVTGVGIVYRSGDLGRIWADGSLEYMGRKDLQIKIRGYRVEPGEIEAAIDALEGIGKSVVRALMHQNGECYLAAYCVCKEGEALDVDGARDKLKTRLPDYMIPQYMVKIDRLPLTPNGKVDWKALPDPVSEADSGLTYDPPSNEIEEKLVEIWKEVLKLDRVGVNNNFFELGGHSLKASMTAMYINDAFNTEITINDLFESQTIADIARLIQQKYDEADELERILDDIEAL